jgi:acetyl-CoA synthetase
MAMELIKDQNDYRKIYKQSVETPEQFWADIAASFHWRKKWDKVLEWDFHKPEVKWFLGGKLNITENCIDRHLPHRANQTAILWESNDVNEPSRKITYQQLHDEVCKVGNMLKSLGVKKGDRVCIYMPMVPEAAYAMLGCARIGAVHSVVFAGFSAGSLIDRINDSQCKVVLTADGAFRGDKMINLKSIVDEALEKSPTIEKCVVLERTKSSIQMKRGRDSWWHDEMKNAGTNCAAEEMDAEDMLFILYTSGSTGKPKGMVHTCGGYMVYSSYTFNTVFQYKEGQVYWCTADVGWITGHSYIVYGPLSVGATTLMFEGVPSWPDMGRFWQVIEKHKVNIFYTAPTAIRSLEKAPLSFVEKYNLSSLQVLGSVGEPINEEAWHWYDKNIGKNNCPIVDTWWQTETGGIMISPIAGITKTKPAFATLPLPGVQLAIMDENGKEISGSLPAEASAKAGGAEGRLTIKFPWPSMARTIYGNHQRFKETYFSIFPGKYFTGDGCKRDEDGYYRITGRVDDVIIVSGHNMGTAEIESAIDEHSAVCESAVVGFPHDIKGQGVYAFVVTYEPVHEENKLRNEIKEVVSKIIGPIAKPDKIQFVSGLPKTRSGKIMRRILRKVAEGDTSNLGDTTTLLDPSVVDEIKKGAIS